MDFSDTLNGVAGFLEENEFRYALIGGLSLAAYGYPRATLDIDLVVEIDHQDRIIDYLEQLGFTTLHRSRGYSNHQHADPRLGRIDFVYVGAETATKLFGATIDHKISAGRSIPVPKPEHLIAMKVLAMKNDPQRTLREMADIQVLMSRPGVDRQEIRRYFERHGLLERYDELDQLS